MKYDFDRIIDRRGTNSYKWDLGDPDVLPMWVADMDFEVPEPVLKAVVEKAQQGIYGYSVPGNSYFDAIVNWEKKRHGWEIQREWIVFSPGVVPGINMMVRAFTQPGDKVIVQTPVYYPFFRAIINNGCQIEKNPLKLENGKYHMDFKDLEQKASDPRANILILCSPHNPVGRVWTRDELERLGEICLRNKVLVISDEIHSDLVFKGSRHTPFALASRGWERNCLTCIAPSKTFNLAGLQTSAIIIQDPLMRRRFLNVLESNLSVIQNIFGITALEAAYTKGEEWLDELLEYLEGNLNFLVEYVRERLPMVEVIRPEGTYLVWMDFRKLGMDSGSLEKFMLEKAKIWLDEGYIFGREGEGIERINIACPRSVLAEGLSRIERAVKAL